MKKIKLMAFLVSVMFVTSCCSQKKAAEAQKVQPVTSEPLQNVEPVSKMSSFVENNEYIFSSEAKTSTEKLNTIFSQLGIVEVKPLGGEQYLLKFSAPRAEADLLAIIKENGLTGSVSQNKRYQAPPPNGGKRLLKKKLNQ